MTKNKQIACQIYLEFFGHLDDKHHFAIKNQEILDWLEEGESDDFTLAELKAEWAEYDADEIDYHHDQ